MTSNEEIITEQPRSSICESTVCIELESGSKSKNTNEQLKSLKDYDTLVVEQEMDVIGSLCGCCDKLNKYSIKDKPNGKTILTAIEEDICCNVSCCRTNRKFDMRLLDENGDEVIHLSIPGECNCCRCCCCCCKFQKLNVYSPPDRKIGTIKETWNCFRKQLQIYSHANYDPLYNIDGPICEMSKCCCSDFEFAINNYESGEECGSISKKWSGLTKEVLTDIDDFGIIFPKNAELNEKALLLGTCIMIDLMYFENRKKSKKSDKDKEDD